jgi:hypothetical protein
MMVAVGGETSMTMSTVGCVEWDRVMTDEDLDAVLRGSMRPGHDPG